MVDLTAAYDEVRERFSAVALGLDHAQAELPVRSCPGWSVHDVLAHHVGVITDASTGNAPEIPEGVDFLRDFDQVIGTVFADMSARQVRERASVPVAQLVDEWGSASRLVWSMFRGERPVAAFPIPPEVAPSVVMNDVIVHEGDVRAALGLEPAPETTALSLALTNYSFMAAVKVQAAGLPALRLRYDDREKVIGAGEPVATLAGSRHDLVRVLASRRSREQILAMDWEGDPSPYGDLLPAYGVVDPGDADV